MIKTPSNTLFRLSALSLVATLACAGQASAQTSLRLSTYVNEVDIRYQSFKKFAELVGTKTAGRVKVEIFPSSSTPSRWRLRC